MAEGTLARPKQGVAKMPEVSGSTGQVGGDGGQLDGGWYKHQGTGAELIALNDPITGDAMARAYVRVGYVYDRPVKPGDIKEVGLQPSEDFAKQPERKVEAESEELKGLRARLNALEAAEAQRKTEELKPSTQTEESQQHAQEAAWQKVAERGTDNSGDVAANGGVNASVAPDKAPATDEPASDGEPSMNDLRAYAKQLGLNAGGTKEELKARIADAEKEDK